MSNKHRERGASLPETAIVMSVLLALTFGIIDFGRAMYTYGFVAQLAREGTRWAAVRGADSCANSTVNGTVTLPDCNATQSDIQSYVQSLSQGATVASSIVVSAPTYSNCPSGLSGNAPGCTVSLTVSYPFKFVALPRAGITMSSTSQMVISQ
jgi:Flp pilus assembly protein TadG